MHSVLAATVEVYAVGCKVILCVYPQVPTEPNENPFTTYLWEGFQNDPLGYPFWRTGKRKQSYIVWNLGRSSVVGFLGVGFFFSCWVPTRGTAPGFATYSHCMLACSNITRGSPVRGTGMGIELIHQEISAKWQHGIWGPIDCNICLQWWILSLLLCHNHTQGLLLLLFKLVLPVIHLWNKTGEN